MWQRLCALLLAGLIPAALAHAQTVERAPAFAVRDTEGKLVTLTDFDERVLILEWTHPECEAAQQLYQSGALPALQQRARDAGAIWLTVFSAARGKDGFQESDKVATTQHDHGANSTASLVDETGIMARMYKVTHAPHLIIIDIAGRIAWQISGVFSTDVVEEAITTIIANRTPEPATAAADGCEIAI
ncbi:MAG: redoxin domain-containing protein [Spongiibacteraceae bacterium]|jgi:hypothetical protein|nr:redoxin domain-containing protein [Spongiibacteraceae bacterium]